LAVKAMTQSERMVTWAICGNTYSSHTSQAAASKDRTAGEQVAPAVPLQRAASRKMLGAFARLTNVR
jgi:hypothetical protein